MSYLEFMRERAQSDRARRMQQASIDASNGGPIPRLPSLLAGRQVMQQAQQQGSQPQQEAGVPQQFGPPMPPSFQVPGYTKGLGDAGPDAQSYADRFAGGDVSKIKSRLINIDGQMKNDYYTKGLLDFDGPSAPPPGVAPDVSSGGYGPPQPDWLDKLRMMFNFGGAS